MAYLHARNPGASGRYDTLATQYMRLGEALGIRWDMAFFQMVLETGALSYTGDVRASQNNFAGLGASGGGKRGERFADIPSGVKAHLQHLLMYAGEHINDPVADRTRKVQEWGVLTDWQNSIQGPMTFSLIAQQWAPGSRGYVRDIKTIADGFYDSYCNAPDPQPGLVHEARGGRAAPSETQVAELIPPIADQPQETAAAANPPPSTPESGTGAQIAQRAIEEARSENPKPTGLLGAPGAMLDGVAAKASAATTTPSAEPTTSPAAETAAVTLINPSTPQKTPDTDNGAKTATAAAATAKPAQTAMGPTQPPKPPAKSTQTQAAAAATETAKNAGKTEKPSTTVTSAPFQTASVAGAATQLKVPEAKTSAGKCKVWTASYGGQRAVLIRADGNGTKNYTVLDVNAASEKREVDAYISAYAKGGKRVGAFSSQAQALDKAFELCPEG
jgi:hypothetical protein